MIEESRIRRLLIESCHSSGAADEFFRSGLDDVELLNVLVKIARDAECYLGDSTMQAAYWMSQYSPQRLIPHESAVLEMLPIIDGYGGHLALALGKTRSERGRAAIIDELGDGKRFDAWLFHEALRAATLPA